MNDGGIDRACINALRFLSVDMVEKARSGHPGLPLGAAPMAYVLWTRFLRYNPRDPQWWDRDRFVLSAGHGSALLYSLLYLTGYELPIDELKSFRQWGSRTPGHPERGRTAGVEASTGPLGQGLGNAVGMAIAEAQLSAGFARPGHDLFRHFTYVLASDGDMMEGVQSEAASLAGHLGLGRLIVLYDDNHVTLSGSTPLTFTEDVAARYRAYGWQVQSVGDGNDLDAIQAAIQAGRDDALHPTLISVRTVLGYGSPGKQGSFKAHGSPLGEEETRRTKAALGWPTEPAFFVPEEVLSHFRQALPRGQALQDAWMKRLESYEALFPTLAREIRRRFSAELTAAWDRDLPVFEADASGLATRKASHAVLQALAQALPEVVGGSGDLDPSTFSALEGCGDLESPRWAGTAMQGLAGGELGFGGRNIHYGVREHAMAAITNGLACHGAFIPFAATFFVFSDYLRPAVRLAALSGLRSIFVFTHDSIGVGEDGPSHQPVEQLASLRAMPGLLVLRPADANETRWAWQVALEEATRPTVLVLSRQDVPTLDRHLYASAEGLRKGAYILNATGAQEDPQIILMASGSEVALIVAAEARLRALKVRVRLVSMPCWRLFEEQSPDYREEVLPASVTARLAVEAASPFGWERWTGLRGDVMGLDRFGASAPAALLFQKFGFTVDQVIERSLALLGQRPAPPGPGLR
jgi:transketolase